ASVSTVSREARPSPARRPGARPGTPEVAPPPPPPPSEADGRRTRTAPAARPGLVNAAELENARRSARAVPERPVRRADQGAFARGRLTVSSATTESDRDRGPSLAAMRRRRDKKLGRNQQAMPKLAREVTIPEAI